MTRFVDLWETHTLTKVLRAAVKVINFIFKIMIFPASHILVTIDDVFTSDKRNFLVNTLIPAAVEHFARTLRVVFSLLFWGGG